MSSVLMHYATHSAAGALPCASHPMQLAFGNMRDLAPKLRAALDRAGITARDLAGRIGLDESTVSLWLSGQRTPRMKNLEKVAQALGIELAELWLARRPRLPQRRSRP